MSVASTIPSRPDTTTAPTVRFPGGATARQTCAGAGWVALAIEGELDAFDKYALIDALTAHVFAGCERIHIDAAGLTFIDSGAFGSFDRVRRFLERNGGTLTISGLGPTAEYMWARLTAGPAVTSL